MGGPSLESNMTDVAIEQTSFQTWDDCLSLSNGAVELVATTGIGPRVLSLSLPDGENLFYTDPDQEPIAGLEPFRLHGGHRLWHAPEDEDRTYVPDNDPVEWETTDRGVRLTQPTEDETGIQKTMSLSLAEEAPVVEVTHELTNEGVWPVECAPWGISIMRPGGTAVVPLSGGDPSALLPDRSLSIWPYTDLSDERLSFGPEALFVDQDAAVDGRVKVGASGADEWAGYVTDGVGFVKEFAYDAAATYPDSGCAVEVYTDDTGLEVETVGPLQTLAPGQSAVHTETWRLVEGADAAGLRDAMGE